jgi:chorismate mutase
MKDCLKEIKRRRSAIDKIDIEIVKLLNRRVRYVTEIGKIKKRAGIDAHAPKREKEVLRNASGANGGPLTGSAVKRLFRQIIMESRRLECKTMHETKKGRKI